MRPYDKFKKYGPSALTDEELLAIIIRTGTAGTSSVHIAEQLLQTLPEQSLLGLHHANWKDLMKISGIGEVKAIKLSCIAQLAGRISKQIAGEKLRFDKPDTVAEYYMESMRHLEQEEILLVMLDKRLQLLGDSIVAIGTVDSSILPVREVFVTALQNRAVQIMLLHNHPSGDPTPSVQDIAITKEIAALGAKLHLPLLDHIIIGDNRFVSLAQSKLL